MHKWIKVTRKGTLEVGKCILKKHTPKDCFNCDNLLSTRQFLGRVDKILCKNIKNIEKKS